MPPAEPSRLYLVTPESFDPAAFAEVLAAALDAGDVACVRLALETDDDGIRQASQLLVPVCQARDAAFLLAGRPHLVAETGADGCHIDGPIDGTRAALPENAILGAGCGLSRHDALIAGEWEADYVSFGPMGEDALEIVAWWNRVVVLPSVIEGIADTDAAARAVEAGADFLALDPAVWDDARGPAQAVAALDAIVAKDRGR
jgi:thiamine-phosphate pyrophosphorylase